MSTTPPDEPTPILFGESDAENRIDPQPRVVRVVPPSPGVWMSLAWCAIYVVATQFILSIIILALALVILIGNQPDSKAIVDAILDGTKEGQAHLERFVGRALAWTIVIEKPLEVVFSFLLMVYVVGRGWARKVAFRWPSFQHLMLTVIGIPAIWVCGAGVGALIEALIPEQSGEMAEMFEQLFTELNKFPAWVGLMAIAVCPGFAEEFLCRAMLGRGLQARLGLWGGILVSSVLFGAIHVLPAQAVYAAFLGVGLHAAYYFTRSLWVPIILHFGNNAISTLLSRGAGGAEAAVEAESSLPLLVYLAGVLLLVAVGYAIYRSRCRYVSADGESEPWRAPYPGVMLPPSASGTVVHAPFAGVIPWLLVVLATGLFAFAVLPEFGADVALGW